MNKWTKVALVGVSLYFLHKLGSVEHPAVKKEKERQAMYDRMFVGIVENYND